MSYKIDLKVLEKVDPKGYKVLKEQQEMLEKLAHKNVCPTCGQHISHVSALIKQKGL